MGGVDFSGFDVRNTYRADRGGYATPLGPRLGPAPGARSGTVASGSSYNSGGSGYNYNAAAAAAAAARQRALAEEEARNTINAGYDDYINRDLNKLLEMSGESQNARLGELTARKSTEANTLQSKLDRTMGRLGESRNQVEQSKASSLSDVGRNFARQLQSGKLSLASRGAADSSAVGQMAYGLTGAQAQSRGDIFGQANQQFTNIGLQEKDAENDFNSQNTLLDDWFRNEQRSVLDRYGNFRTQIEREKAGANLERSQALANLNKAMAQNLSGKLANLQSSFAQISKELSDQLAASKPNLDTQAINQSYQVQPIQRQPLPGLSFGENPPAREMAQAYYPLQGKKQDQNLATV